MILPASIVTLAALLVGAPPQKTYQPTPAEIDVLRQKTTELGAALARLKTGNVDDGLLADVEVYHKAADWALRYASQEFYARRYVDDALAALDRGLARAQELAAGRPSWPGRKGRLVRAYRSRVDGSVQPYGLFIPDAYSGKPMRLDLVLHGRGGTLTEVSFIAAHNSDKPPVPEPAGIRLDVYGRGNNAYRWAGETDVFEALQSVVDRYKIDARRIVLRGFSMGGAGAWHLGLHHPGRWAAFEAGAGFTDTKRYARLEDLPPYQDATLHIYDAVDYALNAFNVPTVGYGGEDDKQLQATLNMREQLVQEGFHFKPEGMNAIGTNLPAIFLVGPKTGHKFHPDSKQQSEDFIAAALARPRPRPDRIRFVTYTTRYNECFWLRVDGLEQHYRRAEVDARRDGSRLTLATRNVARLAVTDPRRPAAVTIDGAALELPAVPGPLVLEKRAGRWAAVAPAQGAAPLAKTHGLQGPIDDAFTERFLCVRPTGRPNNPAAHQYALATLDRFCREFAKWMRGDVRVKDDTAVTDRDVAEANLVLFGDPASNALLAKIAPKLPIAWARDEIRAGARSFPASDHVLVMIYPNPLNTRRYVVLNTGHTFGEKEFRGTNALLFPRLGDYAILRVAPQEGDPAVAEAGLFGERWELP